MSDCDHNCSSCSQNCDSRETKKEDFLEPMNSYSNVKKVIGVVSGKGGVGKSFVTSSLATIFAKQGFKSAILDADITGPSIPKSFGVASERAMGNEMGILPVESMLGVKLMSINFLLDSEDTPVVWRGPVIAGTVKQFWSEVVWDDVDYMFVDMPPGTGDVPLTVFQSLPVDGIVIVTSPQELVSMIVKKAVNMAEKMNVPVLGLVENYSYIECPDCGKKIEVFGKSHADEIAAEYKMPVLAKLPIDPSFAALVDAGKIEEVPESVFKDAVESIKSSLSGNLQ